MPEEKNAGQVETQETQATETANSEINVEAITEKVKAELEAKYKNEISGLNRKVGETEKQLRERLTAEEQKKIQDENERREWLEDMAKIQAETLGLDEKHASLIKGANKQEIKESAELIKSLIDSISVEKDKQIKKLEDELKTYKAAGEAPKGGNTTPASIRQSLINQYNEAEAKGDADKMFYIKEQIRKLPK